VGRINPAPTPVSTVPTCEAAGQEAERCSRAFTQTVATHRHGDLRLGTGHDARRKAVKPAGAMLSAIKKSWSASERKAQKEWLKAPATGLSMPAIRWEPGGCWERFVAQAPPLGSRHAVALEMSTGCWAERRRSSSP
jgi:hypothetical protein